MRPLADLLGRRVLFDGWLDTWRQTDNRFTDACLTGIVLRDYESAEALRDGIGHVWIRIELSRWESLVECHRITGRRFSLQEPVRGAAEVVQYRRRDGSWDYGLRQLGFFGTDHLASLRSRFDGGGNRRLRFAVTISRYKAEELENLEAALRSILQLLEQREDDWRFTGCSLKEAACNLRGQLGVIATEWQRRAAVQAQAAAALLTRPPLAPALASGGRAALPYEPLKPAQARSRKKVVGFG